MGVEGEGMTLEGTEGVGFEAVEVEGTKVFPCGPVKVPSSICRFKRVYRILAAGGLMFASSATAAKSILKVSDFVDVKI